MSFNTKKFVSEADKNFVSDFLLFTEWSAPSAIGIAGLGGGFEVGAEVLSLSFFVDILTEYLSCYICCYVETFHSVTAISCNGCLVCNFFWYSAVHNSRSVTPLTWQAAVDDEEQRPLLQDILEAAVDDRRQAAVDVEEQRPQLQAIFGAAIDGNHV